jgi:hypothetical protein
MLAGSSLASKAHLTLLSSLGEGDFVIIRGAVKLDRSSADRMRKVKAYK